MKSQKKNNHKPAKRARAESKANGKFNRQLFTLKLSELSRQMEVKSATSDRAALQPIRIDLGPIISVEGAEQGNPYFPDIWNRQSNLILMVVGQLALLPEWLEGVDRAAREVWSETITSNFVRNVLLPEAMKLIGDREAAVKSTVTEAAARMHGIEDPAPAQHLLTEGARGLKEKVNTRYKIEALTLEHAGGDALRQQPAPGKANAEPQSPSRRATLRLTFMNNPTDESKTRIVAEYYGVIPKTICEWVGRNDLRWGAARGYISHQSIIDYDDRRESVKK